MDLEVRKLCLITSHLKESVGGKFRDPLNYSSRRLYPYNEDDF